MTASVMYGSGMCVEMLCPILSMSLSVGLCHMVNGKFMRRHNFGCERCTGMSNSESDGHSYSCKNKLRSQGAHHMRQLTELAARSRRNLKRALISYSESRNIKLEVFNACVYRESPSEEPSVYQTDVPLLMKCHNVMTWRPPGLM